MGEGEKPPSPLSLLDQLSQPGSPLRRQLCVATADLSQRVARDQRRALTQVWLPGFTAEGLIALSCQGAPYAIAGEGDLCALFRCVSCRHTFYPSSPDPMTRGSIGRVFQSHQPEVCRDISGAPARLYHRADAARQCLLHSLCILPLWMPAVTCKAPIAVLEVLQPDPQPDFAVLSSLACLALREVKLTTTTITTPVANSPPDSRTGSPPDNPLPLAVHLPICVHHNGIVACDDRSMPPPARAHGPPRGEVAPRSGTLDDRVDLVFVNEQQHTANGKDHFANVTSRLAGKGEGDSLPAAGPQAHTLLTASRLASVASASSDSAARVAFNGDAAAAALPVNAVAATPPPHVAALSPAERHGSVHNLLNLNRTSSNAHAAPVDSGGSRTGTAPPPQPPAANNGGAALQNTINAIELLHVVEADESWQRGETIGPAAQHQGGSAALLTVLHSVGSGQQGAEEGETRKRPNDVADAPAGRRQFGYPGGGTFIRAAPEPTPAVAAATAAPHAAALQEKVLRAEGFNVAPARPAVAGTAPHGAAPPRPASQQSAAAHSAPLQLAAQPGPAQEPTAALDPEDKAMRGRLNRIDGGVGRRLALETLQEQFGKGLKDAAEALGMCPTTLKRACRRLGVKRWPRTADAAHAVVARASATAAAAAPSPAQDAAAGWQHAQPLGMDDDGDLLDDELGEFLGLMGDEEMFDEEFC